MAIVKKSGLGCVALLLACMLFCALFRSLRAVIGVYTARREPVDLYELVLDASVFPQSWYTCLGPVRPPERARGERLERDMLYAGFCPEGFDQGIGGAQHAVFEYGDELGAAMAFRWDFSRHEFSNRYTVSPWAVPEQWSYRSSVADRFKFACAYVEPFGSDHAILSCNALAQYDQYVSYFQAQLSHMTLDDLERVVVAIDERMAFHLKEDTE